MSYSRPSFIELLNKSYAFYGEHAKVLAKVSLVYILFLLPFELIFWSNTYTRQFLTFNFSLQTFEIIEYLITITEWFIFFLYFIAIFKTIHKIHQNTWRNVKETYQEAVEGYKEFMKTLMLYLWKVLSGLLLIVPGLIRAVRYSLFGMTAIIEGQKGQDALKLSEKYIKANFNRYLDFVFFISLIIFVSFFIYDFITDWPYYYLLRRDFFLMTHMIDWMGGVVLIFMCVYAYIFYYFLYEDLKCHLKQNHETD